MEMYISEDHYLSPNSGELVCCLGASFYRKTEELPQLNHPDPLERTKILLLSLIIMH